MNNNSPTSLPVLPVLSLSKGIRFSAFAKLPNFPGKLYLIGRTQL